MNSLSKVIKAMVHLIQRLNKLQKIQLHLTLGGQNNTVLKMSLRLGSRNLDKKFRVLNYNLWIQFNNHQHFNLIWMMKKIK